MTWTFDSSLATDLAKVRLAIGDVITADQLIADETITALLTSEGSVNGAALKCAESLLARFSRDRDKRVGAMSLSGNRGEFYERLVKQLRRAVSLGAAPFVGGISIAQKQTEEADTDRTVPAFNKNQFAYPGTLPQDLLS